MGIYDYDRFGNVPTRGLPRVRNSDIARARNRRLKLTSRNLADEAQELALMRKMSIELLTTPGHQHVIKARGWVKQLSRQVTSATLTNESQVKLWRRKLKNSILTKTFFRNS